METTYKYKGNSGLEISLTQAKLLGEYDKETFEDGVLKRVEVYRQNEISQEFYFCVESEIESILALNPNAGVSYSVYENGFEIRTNLGYVEGSLASKAITVHDSGGNVICYQPYSINGNPINDQTTKHYYVDNEELIEFLYDNNGVCEFVDYVDQFQTDFYADQIGVDSGVSFTWEGFEYYQFVTPIVPES